MYATEKVSDDEKPDEENKKTMNSCEELRWALSREIADNCGGVWAIRSAVILALKPLKSFAA